MDIESLRILIRHGLGKTSTIYPAWQEQFDQECRVCRDEHMKQKNELSKSQWNDPKSIAIGLMRWLAERVVKKYRYALRGVVKGLDLIIDVPRTLDSDAILVALMSSQSELTNIDEDITKQYGMSKGAETRLVPKPSFYPLP